MDASTIYSTISNSINYMFNNIFSSLDNSIYGILDDFTFINSDVLKENYFDKIFQFDFENGILLIANSLILGYLIYYAFKLLFSHLGITEVERPYQFLFKLLLCSILMNFSLFICDELIYIVSLISNSIRQLGLVLFNSEICFSTLILKLNSIITTSQNSLDIFSIDGIIKSLISLGLLNLVITYAIRFVLIKIFVLISPFSFLSLCNKSTSILFKSWFKAFLSLLLVQIFVAIILLLIFSLNIKSNNMSSKLILFAAIYILIKANNYVKEMIGGISTNANINLSSFKNSFTK